MTSEYELAGWKRRQVWYDTGRLAGGTGVLRLAGGLVGNPACRRKRGRRGLSAMTRAIGNGGGVKSSGRRAIGSGRLSGHWVGPAVGALDDPWMISNGGEGQDEHQLWGFEQGDGD